MKGQERFNEEIQGRLRRQVVDAGTDFLDGKAGVIESARRLSSLAHMLVDDWTADEDFLVIGKIDSESDSLPIGEVRALWDPSALAEQDVRIQRFETQHRPDLEARVGV